MFLIFYEPVKKAIYESLKRAISLSRKKKAYVTIDSYMSFLFFIGYSVDLYGAICDRFYSKAKGLFYRRGNFSEFDLSKKVRNAREF